MPDRSRALVVLLAGLVSASLVAPAHGSDTSDLHRVVREWRAGSEASGGPLVGWTTARARAAVQGVAREKGPEAWSDGEVLAGALFLTARGQRELVTGTLAGFWFDLARQLLEAAPDAARRRTLQRDWMLALAALYNSRYDGLSSSTVVDQAVELFPEDPDVLLQAGRLHEAIASRGFSGVAEAVPTPSGDTVQQELAKALRAYEKLVEVAPERAEARLRCGRVLCLVHRSQAARKLLEPLREPPATGDVPCLARLFLGVVEEQEGHPVAALASYRGALSTGRAPQTGRLAVARLLRRAGDTAGARAVIEAMLADDFAGEEAWQLYQAEGFGPLSGHQARLAALWKQARQ